MKSRKSSLYSTVESPKRILSGSAGTAGPTKLTFRKHVSQMNSNPLNGSTWIKYKKGIYHYNLDSLLTLGLYIYSEKLIRVYQNHPRLMIMLPALNLAFCKRGSSKGSKTCKSSMLLSMGCFCWKNLHRKPTQ